MKAANIKMFPVPLSQLKAEEGVPFPLYIYLEKGQKYLPFRNAGEVIGTAKFELFQKYQFASLYVPIAFQDAYNSFMNPPPPRAEEAALVGDAIKEPELSSDEKAKLLSAVSQDMLRALNQITTRGREARADGLKRCKDIADEILSIAAQNSNIYDEIIALRNSQEDLEHSIIVGTMAAMFGMAIGYTDEMLLADLTVGAIFHDIGLVKISPEVMAKRETDWSEEDRKEYEKHCLASVEILKESGATYHERVFTMIGEHHEHYDGSGYPLAKKGAEISEHAALLHLANLFDRYCTGKQNGTDYAPSEAFDKIYAESQDSATKQEVQPELVQRVFQFMLAEKSGAEKLQQSAGELAEKTAKAVGA